MSISVKLLKSLNDEIINLTRRMEVILPSERDTVMFVRSFFELMTAEHIMQHVIDKILPWEKQIETRDENFFLGNKGIFGDLPEGKLDFYSNMVGKGVLSDDDKEEIFQFFEVFVECAKQYKALKV